MVLRRGVGAIEPAGAATSGGSSALGDVDECYDNQPVVGTPAQVSVISSDETAAGVDAGLSGGTDYTVCFNGSGGIGVSVAFGYFDQCFDDQSTSSTAMPVTVLPAVTAGEIGAAMVPRTEPRS